MTRFVVDASAVIHLASNGVEVSDTRELLAPTLLRSQTLSALHEAVQRGEIPADVARDHLARIGRMKIRLLGDGVLDHDVTLPSGEVIYNPMRVVPHGDGSEVVFSVRRLPDMSDEDFARDAGLVQADLARLKHVLEATA